MALTKASNQIIINDIPPSLNYTDRMPWQKRNRVKKEWHELVYYAWIEAGKPKYNIVEIEIVYYFKDRRKRDYDNYSGKFLLDPLKGNAITDDNQSVIKRLLHRFEYDKINPRTVIEIKEIG